jgi:hypothetical protein
LVLPLDGIDEWIGRRFGPFPFDGFFLDFFEPILFLSVFEHNGDFFLDILETMEGVFFYILEPCTMLTYNALF